jgi:dTDP-4-dehydrorhamnose reductase
MGKPLIIVTGKNGQLGSELTDLAPEYPQFDFAFFGRDELDISNPEQVEELFTKLQPTWVVNCGAYTAVDKAETEKDKALAINATGVGTMAKVSKQVGANFIHVSTDYVFNGQGTEPYKEDDTTDPVNYYGYTKLLGEQQAMQNNENSVVIRTSWVYSRYGNNFVKTMMRLMKDRPEIRVVADQTGSPTYAKDLAEAIMHIIAGGQPFTPGIYHFSNSGVITWHQFASTIQQLKQFNSIVHAIPTAAYPTPAKRPAYSVMSKDKIVADYGVVLKGWEESLRECLEGM